jgi:hypothetical protein
MKNPRNAVGETEQVDRPLSMKERAKKARHEAYVLAKERRKNDPRTIQFAEKMKERRREANAQAKIRRKNDPTQIAHLPGASPQRGDRGTISVSGRDSAL